MALRLWTFLYLGPIPFLLLLVNLFHTSMNLLVIDNASLSELQPKSMKNFSAKNSHLILCITSGTSIFVIRRGVKIKILKKFFETIQQQSDHRFEFLDLKIVDLSPKIIKIGPEMTILELWKHRQIQTLRTLLKF